MFINYRLFPTLLLGLALYALGQRLAAEPVYTEDLSAIAPPAILGVKLDGGFGHFVTLLGHDRGRLVVGDPLVGRLVLSEPEFSELYSFTGMAMQFRHGRDPAP